MLRQGSGEPIVLFHGILGSERMWRGVVPLLALHNDAIAPTALGHAGGPPPLRRPARIVDVIDDAERVLDSLGLPTAHLVGNSMGGWVAIELARRGRARSVCAFSPAGFWDPAAEGIPRAVSRLRRTIRDARRGRPLMPILSQSGRFRRWAMQLNAVHADRMTAAQVVGAVDDLLGCVVAQDLLATTEGIAPFDRPPCPMTLVWAARDRVLPMKDISPYARRLLPEARYLVLDDVGHVPMFDDSALVARTILESIEGLSAPMATGTV
jgi:pimeloyl-ACP methyl ester carboxylesterase